MKLLIPISKSIFYTFNSIVKVVVNVLITTSLLLPIFSQSVQAQGVTAGTVISNTVTVSYYLGPVTGTPETFETTNTFVVAEIINATLTSLDLNDVVVPTPSIDRVLSWDLTNTGNGTESFNLTTVDTLTGDDFNPEVQSIWLETNGIAGLQSTDTLYQPANPVQLANDASQRIYVRSNIPANLSITELGNVQLIATSTTAGITSSSIGDVLTGVGDVNTNVVVLVQNGRVDNTSSFRISNVALELNKTISSVVDPFSGTDVMSQSLITYQIDVHATGDANGTLENLVIEDSTPANMQFVAGSITLNGVALSDVADADKADFGITSANTATINLGDIVPPSHQIITITYRVN